MKYGPKTEAFYQKNKQLEADNPLANIDQTQSLHQLKKLFDIEEFRHNTREFFKDLVSTSLSEDMDYQQLSLENCVLRIYTSKQIVKPAPVIIYNIAGGFVLDMAEEQTQHCCKLARTAEAIVVSIVTGLAPEFNLAQIFEQAYVVIKKLYRHANEYGFQKHGFFLAGYSVGAKLSLLIALRAKTDQDLQIKGLALISGDYDPSDDSIASPDVTAAERDFMGKPGMRKFFLSQYLPELDMDLHDPLIAPYYAELAKLPPIILIVGDCDCFYGTNKAMVKKLLDANVDAELIINTGHIHNTTLLYDCLLGDGKDPIIQAGQVIKQWIYK